jgi:hypothetical protein
VSDELGRWRTSTIAHTCKPARADRLITLTTGPGDMSPGSAGSWRACRSMWRTHRPQRSATPGPHRRRHRPGGGRGHRPGQVQLRLWGDTVNTASRMESLGVPGCIRSPLGPTSACGTATGSSGGDWWPSRVRARWSRPVASLTGQH